MRRLLVTVALAVGLLRAAATAQAASIVRYEIAGATGDDPQALARVLATRLPLGTEWDAAGDEIVRGVLDILQLEPLLVRAVPEDGGVVIHLEVAPWLLVRRVVVSGNWPLFRHDVERRLSLRAGARLPRRPAAQTEVLSREADRVRSYLEKEGYFEGGVDVRAEVSSDATEAVIHVNLKKGPCYTLGKIGVKGNASVDDPEITSLMRRFRLFEFCGIGKDRFSREELEERLRDVERLYHERGFPRARAQAPVDPSQNLDRVKKVVNLTVEISEQKKIDVEFQGNDKLNDNDLNKVLTFATEQSYDDVTVESSAEAIRRRYQQSGYFQAVVGWERVRLLPTFERVIFTIDEGPKLPVRRIRFRGNQQIPSATLEGAIVTRPYSNYFARGGYLTSLQLEQDRQAILEVYHQAGYPVVKVDARVAPSPALGESLQALAVAVTAGATRGGLWIDFVIDEGPRELVERVQIIGNKAITDKRLERELSLLPGKPFTDVGLRTDVEKLRTAYLARAYPYTQVSATQRPGSADGKWTVIYEVNEGKRVKFGETIVRGNFRTKQWVIRDEIGYERGDWFTRRRIDAARRGLLETRLFQGQKLDPIGLDQGAEEVHLVVTVEESHDNHGDLELAGGYSTDQSFFASTVYGFRNILGVGASFVARGELGTLRQFGEANLALPRWLMSRGTGVPLQLDLTGSLLAEDHPRFGDLTATEGRVTLSRRWDRLNVALSYAYRRYGRTEELVRPAGQASSDTETAVETTTASIGPSIVYDARTDIEGNPNPLTPSAGYRLTASFLWASTHLLGTDDFLKASTSGQYLYTPKWAPRVTFTNGVRYDHGVPLGGAVLLPEVERYFGGGDTTVRGLSRDHLATEIIRGPLVPGSDVESIEAIPAGGNIRFIHNVDLQLRVSTYLATAVFLDTGLITNSLQHFEPHQLRHALGLSFLRLTTPFAALSFEYAIPLDPAVGDNPLGRFHFNVGFLF